MQLIQFLFARLEKGKSNLSLVKQVYTAKRIMDSQLTLSMEKTVKESTVKKYRIICIVSTSLFKFYFYFTLL